jgi:fructose-specific phosphotransferase system IIC component
MQKFLLLLVGSVFIGGLMTFIFEPPISYIASAVGGFMWGICCGIWDATR